MEDEVKSILPAVADGLLEKIKNYIKSSYEPVTTMTEADVRMTTAEICEAIQRFYPCEFSPDIMAKWLHDNGYSFFDAGKMRFEWLFKTAS